jgi:hypothetical protein
VVVIQLRKQVMQFRGIFGFERPDHPGFQNLPVGIGLFHGGLKTQATTDLIFIHPVPPIEMRRENSEQMVQNASA